MKKYLFLLPVIVLLWSCKGRKAAPKEEDITVTDFMEFFPKSSPPFRVADTTLEKRIPDSISIKGRTFTRFIPDSILKKDFGATMPRLYPLGRVREKGHETYLFFKAVQGGRKAGYVATFNKDNEFQQVLPLVKNGTDYATSAYGLLDNKMQLTIYREKKKKGELISFKRNVYVFNASAGAFVLILTEPNEEIIENVINPIDTLPARHRYSADYVKDKRNFVSVRDGRNNSEFLFFMHFEKENGACRGELKGSAKFTSATRAVFNAGSNPCNIEFSFSPTIVYVKEKQGCGAYRDIKCFFEGVYPRKKMAKGKHTGKKPKATAQKRKVG